MWCHLISVQQLETANYDTRNRWWSPDKIGRFPRKGDVVRDDTQ
jgi:hypothetical protein